MFNTTEWTIYDYIMFVIISLIVILIGTIYKALLLVTCFFIGAGLKGLFDLLTDDDY